MKNLLYFCGLLISCSAVAGIFGTPVRVPGVSEKGESLAIDGKTLYCGAGGTLYVFDIAEPLRPKLLTKVEGLAYLRQMQVENGWLVASSRGAGAWIVDVRDPARAKVVSNFDTVEQATGIEIAGNLMFVGQRNNGVEIVDITDRAHPEHIRMVPTPESQTCRYEGGYLYSGDWHSGSVNAIDVSDLSKARIVGSTEMQGLGDGLDAEGTYIYASTGHHRLRGAVKDPRDPVNRGRGHGLEIWDRTDAAHPKFVSRVDFPVFWRVYNDMWTCREANGWVFCADTYNGLFAVDARDPAQPKVVDRFCDKDPADSEAPSRCISYVAVGDGAVYAAVLGSGLWVIPCAEAKFRPQNRGGVPEDVSWREPYATTSERFGAWQPPRRGQVHSVAAKGDWTYVGCSAGGAYVLDKDFKTAGTIPCAYARDVFVRDDTLYVAQGDDGLGIYSLEDPAHPREIRRVREIQPGVSHCEWVYVPNARWAVCHPRQNRGRWTFLDLAQEPAKIAQAVAGMDWQRPFANDPVGGKWLGYAHTHSFFKWFDVSGAKVSMIDTEDKAEKGPLSFRTNLMRTKTGCCVFQDRILIANTGSFILLDPAQDRNADGTPWPTFGYANSKMGPTGLPIWDGGTRVALAANSRKEIQMADFSDPEKPKLLWTEKTVGYPENAVFARGRLLVPCGYQGLLYEREP